MGVRLKVASIPLSPLTMDSYNLDGQLSCWPNYKSADELAKSIIIVLDAIVWISSALKLLYSATESNCFKSEIVYKNAGT